MKLTKSETNNAIVTTLANVRKHPNADRLKLATVLGTQVIVGLEAKNGDLVIYFDSNLCLSHDYLHWNNLYTDKELNVDSAQKGYFGKRGRVRAQRFRGEISNGYVAEIESLFFVGIVSVESGYAECGLKDGVEFTHINDIEICSKYLVAKKGSAHCVRSKKKKVRVWTDMFWKHWDTKQLMRETDRIVPGSYFLEEKVHGTSGRTAYALFYRRKRWFQFWKPRVTSFWRVVSGTRRVDGVKGHMKEERRLIHEKLAPHIHQGEQLYYEICGHQLSGKPVQKGFTYGCKPEEYKCMLYRVTFTTPDGYRIDLGRKEVYRRAEELGLEKPVLLTAGIVFEDSNIDDVCEQIMDFAKGQSALDDKTLREGVVLWFQDKSNQWTCLKYKGEEFLLHESKTRDENIGDPEDNLQ